MIFQRLVWLLAVASATCATAYAQTSNPSVYLGETCQSAGLAPVTARKSTAQRLQDFEHPTSGPPVMLVPHRGSHSKGIPNNSLLSIHRAIEIGAEMVELDVLLSNDDVPMLLHDKDLHGETDGSGAPGSKSATELAQLKMRDPLGNVIDAVHVSTLESAIKLYGKCILFNIDIKEKVPARLTTAYRKVTEVIEDAAATSYAQAKATTYLKGTLSVQDYHSKIGHTFKYTPKIGEEIADLDTYWHSWSDEAEQNSNIRAFEVRVKRGLDDPDPSPTISPVNYVTLVRNKGFRVGMVDVSWTNWSFIALGPLAPTPVNPKNDHRGDWDFLLAQKPAYVITDRAEALDGYLRILGYAGDASE